MSFFSKLFFSNSTSHVADNGKVDAANAAPEQAAPLLSTYETLKQQGSALLDQGKLEEAEQTYKMALQENLFSSEAHVNLGYVLSELSRTGEAKSYFEKAITLDSNNFDAHLLRAMLAITENDINTAFAAIQIAVKLKPASPQACKVLYKVRAIRGEFSELENNIRSVSLFAENSVASHIEISHAFSGISVQGQLKNRLLEVSLRHLQAAIEIDPHSAEAFTSQGLVLLALNRSDEAISSFECAISAKPSHAEAYFLLAAVQKESGNFPHALENLEKAVIANPNYAEAYKALGDIYYQDGHFNKAAASYKKAAELKPDMVETYIMLGSVQCDLGEFEAAIESSSKAVALRPDAAEVYFGLGNVLAAQNKYPQAVDAYKRSLKLRPSYTDAQVNLGAAFLSLGNYDGALDMFRTVVETVPDHLTAHNNIAYCSSFDASCSASEYLKGALAFGAVATSLAKPYTSWGRSASGEGCLKVGLVSGDFCLHPVGFFLESVIAYLDAEKIELHAFSNRTSSDHLQTSLKSRVTSWTSIVGLPDKSAAKLIHDARLDLLIDLSGHTGKNRLSLFAWRPAPVQATWLGYWASTGVVEIDYILTDRYAVPVENHAQFSEEVRYLPDTRLCFTPPSALYDLACSSSPSVRQHYTTFGSYQPIRKLTPEVLVVWGNIFKQLPTSYFRLQGAGFTDSTTSHDLLHRLSVAGIPKDHVLLFESTPRVAYLTSHAEVDIILDSFPYPGGTTTCDALWMGVPTVTLAGSTMLSRQGVSLLMCAGLSDWIAHTEEDYVKIAVAKARDIKQLNSLRFGLRNRVFESPLFDAPNFAKHLEVALHAMVQDKKIRTVTS